jgi:hypothetical protein
MFPVTARGDDRKAAHARIAKTPHTTELREHLATK